MHDLTILFLEGCDRRLTSVVSQVVAGIRRLRLECVSAPEAAIRRLEHGDVGLLLAYHAGPNNGKVANFDNSTLRPKRIYRSFSKLHALSRFPPLF